MNRFLIIIAALAAMASPALATYTYAEPTIIITHDGGGAVAARILATAEPRPGLGVALDAHVEYSAANGALIEQREAPVAWAERTLPYLWSGALSASASAANPYASATPPAGAATITTWYTARIHARVGQTWVTIGKRSSAKTVRSL